MGVRGSEARRTKLRDELLAESGEPRHIDRGIDDVLLATHDPAVAEECDDEIHLVDGRIEVLAPPPPPPAPGHEHDAYMRPGAVS
mgnify:CR=1 FL=1